MRSLSEGPGPYFKMSTFLVCGVFAGCRFPGHVLASSRITLPGQSRIRWSAVTSWWPSRAVATMMRSAGSPCMSRSMAGPDGDAAVDGYLDEPFHHVATPCIQIEGEIKLTLLYPHTDFPE